MFELEHPILAIYFLDSYMNISLSDIISTEYDFHKSRAEDIDPRYIFVCSLDGNAQDAAAMLSIFHDNSFTYVPFSIGSSVKSLISVKEALFHNVGIKDYFNFSDPIDADSLFFGRQRLLTEAAAAARGGQNQGIFGLRRIGKTSILMSLQRSFRQRNLGKIVIFSLDDPSRIRERWTGILSQLAALIDTNSIRDKYDVTNASRLFRSAIQRYVKDNPKQQIVIAFDEIEHIVPTTVKASYSHWKEDYFHLMDNIRAATREIPNFSVIICGINAKSLEQSHFDGIPNPIFSSMSIRNVQMFSYEDVAQMLVRLGLFMGISFDEPALRAIYTEYGGHPLLIRQFCSKLFKRLQDEKFAWPFKVGRSEVMTHIRDARPELHYWANYIFLTLKEFYPDEFEMLKILASDDLEFYVALEDDKPEYSSHLRGYGLVTGRPPTLSMPFLKHYLLAGERRADHQPLEVDDEPEDLDQQYRFAFIAALDDETNAALSLLRRSRLKQVPIAPDQPYVIYTCEILVGKRRHPAIIASTGKMGPSSIQNLIMHLGHRFKIGNIILFGICAGLRGKVDLGDIIVADQIYDYSQGKITNTGRETRPSVFPMSPYLVNAARQLKSFKWPKSYQNAPRKIRSGSLASGPVVFADDNSLMAINASWPVAGAEMEAAGAAYALHNLGRLNDFAVIKAVSDFGDASKDDAHRMQCCESSAVFAIQLARFILGAR